MKLRIAVIGRDGEIPQELKEVSEAIGAEIAKKGCVLVCGGKGGVMLHACKGAKEHKGITVGILPSLEKEEANPHVDVVITTGMGYGRNNLVVASADAVVVVDGKVGTLSEVAMALNYGKPLIVVRGSGGVADNVLESLERMGIEERSLVKIVSSPEEAVRKAIELARGG